ncbi:RNA-processing protein [Candidatus Woesearchaeota archaeon]|nr:RNA-processing protein [Candidatus Woesearchaeota archaeon]
MDFNYEVKVPKDRVAVLLGVKGSIKRKIQTALNIKLIIDSKTGDVVLEGKDSLNLLVGQNIVKAIGRGFNPEVALELLNENNHFEIINVEDFANNSKNRFVGLKSRVIGTGGKARKTVEILTDTKIVVYGKTIGIIGNYEGVELARKAFESLLGGSRHSTIYAWLDRQKKKLKIKL